MNTMKNSNPESFVKLLNDKSTPPEGIVVVSPNRPNMTNQVVNQCCAYDAPPPNCCAY